MQCFVEIIFQIMKAPFTQLFSVHTFLKGSEGNTKQVPLACSYVRKEQEGLQEGI